MKNHTRAAALAATFALASAGAFARSEVCMDVSEGQIAGLFDGWNASLQTGDPKLVVARYAQKSVLLTLSDSPRLTPQAKEDYFVHFLARKPVSRIDSRSIEIDCNTAIDIGLYTFRFGDGSEVKARYTYTYKRFGNQWLITSHHSSVQPKN